MIEGWTVHFLSFGEELLYFCGNGSQERAFKTAFQQWRWCSGLQCRISYNVGKVGHPRRMLPSGWSWGSNFLMEAVIPCSPALPGLVTDTLRWATVMGQPCCCMVGIWCTSHYVGFKRWNIVSGCLWSAVITCRLWSSTQGNRNLFNVWDKEKKL